jgi:hypothetical protein
MISKSLRLSISALIIFLGTTVVFLYVVLNFKEVPLGISIIVLLCAIVMYKQVYNIAKALIFKE